MKVWFSVLILPLALAAPQATVSTGQSRQAVPQQSASQQANVPDTRAKAGEPCSVEGQVVNAATGEPVKKASINLQRADPQPGVMFTPGYGTTTDAAGRFAMKDIDPGKYRVSVRRTGFVDTSYGARGPRRPGTTLTLEPGQTAKEINFRMIPHAVIAGRIVDEDGEPLANVQVQAMRYVYVQGKKQLMPSGSASTNDLGEYRLFGLPAGRYYLSATLREMTMGTIDRSANVGPDEGYVPTYYPGTTDAASAGQVEVLAGAQLRGLDLTLSRARTVRVKGHVTLASGGRPRNLQVMLMPRETGSFVGSFRPIMADPQGRFEIRGVAPGSYTLTAMTFDGDRNVSAREPLDVGSSNLENINITIQSPTELTGQIKVDGPTQASLADVRLTLRPHNLGAMMFGMSSAKIKDDGSFTISNVSPDIVDFEVSGLPDGFYLKSVRAAENEVLETGLDLTHGFSGPVALVFGTDAGQVDGIVLNARQQPAQVSTVVLIPKDEKQRQRRQLYKTATTDQYGRYTIKNVDPGEYKIYAWEDVEYGAYMDPDFVKPVEDHGQSVSVRPSGKESAQLKLIPAEDSQAQPASTSANR